jgi:hypothetical protein
MKTNGRPRLELNGVINAHGIRVVRFIGVRNNKDAIWLCVCPCGQSFETDASSILQDKRKSCGCRKSGRGWKKPNAKTERPEYTSWSSMVERCTNPKATDFHRYGGRGITVCSRWNSFENFLADMGERPPGTSIGRIKNNIGYEPGNCRWETPTQQSRNTIRTRFFTIDGIYACITEHCERIGISKSTVANRLRAGLTAEEAFLKARLDTGTPLKMMT